MRLLPALLALLLLALPVAAQDEGASPDGTITIEDTRDADAAMAVRIREILSELRRFADVTVQVNSGVVTLRGEVAEAAVIDELNALVSRMEGVVSIENRVTETADVVQRLNPAWDRLRARLWQLVAYLPLVFVAGVVFAVILAIGLWVARRKEPWERLAPNAFIAQIYRQLAGLFFVIVGIVVALDILNATALLGTILGAAGLIGLAIGFAVRDTVENFIASIMLSFRQPFRPNDAVEIGGDEGKVIRLTSRATILLSWDGNHIRIPNSTVFKSRIVNYSTNAERRIKFEIGVASDADLAAVRQLATETVEALPFIIDAPAPMVWIDRIGDGAIFLTVTGWIDQNQTSLLRAQGEAIRHVKAAIEATGVEVPDTTYRIQMLSAPGDDARGAARARPSAAPAAPRLDAVADVGVEAERELDQIIEAERAATETDDLLDERNRSE